MDYTGKVITKNPVTPNQASASGVWTLDEALQAQKGNNWPVPGVYNPISRSLRFNSADSTYLNRTPASASNRKTWTWSGWCKVSKLGINQYGLFSARNGVVASFTMGLLSSNDFVISGTSISLTTSQVFRDVSAWYHIVLAIDTTQATDTNRVKLYVNGNQVTAFSSTTYPAQNTDLAINSTIEHNVGKYAETGNFVDGYMTEINFIDGQALTPSDFGLADPATGVWVPKKYTGTYGTNGFYLNFKDNSNTTTIGYDYSGNGNNWNANNFSVTAGAGNDSLTDVPTLWIGYSSGGDTGGVVRGNYCTLSPLPNGPGGTLSNGNLYATSGVNSVIYSTFALTSEKFYWEVTLNGSTTQQIGLADITKTNTTNSAPGDSGRNGYVYLTLGYIYNNGTALSSGLSTSTTNDVICCAYDSANNKLWIRKNDGTWFGGGNPATGSTPTATTSTSYTYTPVLGAGGGSDAVNAFCNFGQRPFAYTPPAGFLSLCTTNLPTPTIGTTSTTLAEDYFNTVLYTGTGATLGVTGVGFQPDFVWIKSRSAATDHALYDVVRGDKNQLESNTTTAETNETTGLTGFNADGFTVGSLAQVNTNTATYVGWNWKAGGVGVTNTAGSITSTVSANTTAGFSIVTFTALSSGTGTIGHGLGVAPSMIIVKSRAAAYDWAVYHTSLGNTAALKFTTGAANTDSGWWNNTSPTSSVFTLSTLYNGAGNCVAYCFAPVAGYSAFGSYTGNGSTDGPFVYLGFRPKFLMVKLSSTGTESWQIVDTSRDPYNVSSKALFPNLSSAEVDASSVNRDILSNGFKIRSSDTNQNGNGSTYIYAAFAEFPFKFSNAR